jgi:hypothetical protein
VVDDATADGRIVAVLPARNARVELEYHPKELYPLPTGDIRCWVVTDRDRVYVGEDIPIGIVSLFEEALATTRSGTSRSVGLLHNPYHAVFVDSRRKYTLRWEDVQTPRHVVAEVHLTPADRLIWMRELARLEGELVTPMMRGTPGHQQLLDARAGRAQEEPSE